MSDVVSFQPIRPVQIQLTPTRLPGTTPKENSADFRTFFEDAVGSVEGLRQEARAGIDRFLTEGGEDAHSMILGVQKADLAFQFFLQVRNKFTQAYQEVMRMQL
jgi:flagellar hook-basal body complex protein FliE